MRKSKTNVMRTPEEKELIVLETFENGINKTFKKHGVDKRLLQRWVKKYRENGIDGLRSKTGKSPGGRNRLVGLSRKKNKTKEEELQLKVMKLEIEVARLKKGTK